MRELPPTCNALRDVQLCEQHVGEQLQVCLMEEQMSAMIQVLSYNDQ
jgi:hypothetical protein